MRARLSVPTTPRARAAVAAFVAGATALAVTATSGVAFVSATIAHI